VYWIDLFQYRWAVCEFCGYDDVSSVSVTCGQFFDWLSDC